MKLVQAVFKESFLSPELSQFPVSHASDIKYPSLIYTFHNCLFSFICHFSDSHLSFLLSFKPDEYRDHLWCLFTLWFLGPFTVWHIERAGKYALCWLVTNCLIILVQDAMEVIKLGFSPNCKNLVMVFIIFKERVSWNI